MGIAIHEACAWLEQLAPLEFAAEWDNVGLLIEPADSDWVASRVLLTIDLTLPVLAEARARDCELVVAYHPTIFHPLRRLRAAVPAERVVLEAVAAGIAVYSPHTALDVAPGGVNDWLAESLGPGQVTALEPPGAQGNSEAGFGRRVDLEDAATLGSITDHVRTRLGLAHLRVAAAEAHQSGALLRRGAVCAGAGGSVLARPGDVDVLLTGEMRHHEVVGHVANGRSVILCDHTNTERGYLPHLARRLVELSGDRLEVRISSRDRDPLEIV